MDSFLQRLNRLFRKQAVATRSFEADARHIFGRLDYLPDLLNTVAQQSRTIEGLLRAVEEQARQIEMLVRITEERSRTLESLARQSLYSQNHQTDVLQNLYVESAPRFLELATDPAFNATKVIRLETNFPLALGSHDHVNPESTIEGVSRPALFVQDCIGILGHQIKSMDLGTGAAGLVFEFAMNGVMSIGVDGSDFCRRHRVGYWPLLANNLFTCDITKPFRFLANETEATATFELITMWEVLEHLAEEDLPGLFDNISSHLDENGYFIGSVSLIEYLDSNGTAYHVTLQPREWWSARFKENGLVMLDSHPFNEKFFCRGNGPRFQDFHNYANNPKEGFLFVAQKVK